MKLEQQVVSLELAKKMKELGFEQESLWYWVTDDLGLTYLSIDSMGSVMHSRNSTRVPNYGRPEDYGWRVVEELYSAYTVAEFGEMLPRLQGYNLIYTGEHRGGKFCCFYQKSGFGDDFPIGTELCKADTEADARAKTLIYLKQKKLI